MAPQARPGSGSERVTHDNIPRVLSNEASMIYAGVVVAQRRLDIAQAKLGAFLCRQQ